jgi:squalene-hopene/tetraprenyl-beta-curcumene cyclase
MSATSRAICGLLAASVDHQDEAIAAGINWLIIRHHESSKESRSSEKGDALPAMASDTGTVLLALVAAGQANHVAARRAVELLLESQCDEGRWNETGFNNYDAASGRWLRNELQSTAEPLLALSRWIVAAAAVKEYSEKGISLRLVGAAADD